MYYLYSLGYLSYEKCIPFEPKIRFQIIQVIKLTQKIIKIQNVTYVEIKQVALSSVMYNTYCMPLHRSKERYW